MIATLAVLLAGCGGTSSSSGPQKAPDDKQILTINLKGPNKGDFASLDPQLIEYGVDYQVAGMIYTNLVRLDKDSKVVADGATSWTTSSDGKTWTFKIRSGMNWADGTPITAADFAYSIARSQDPCVNGGAPSDVSGYLQGQGANELIVGSQKFNQSTCPANATSIDPNPLIGTGKGIEVTDPSTLTLRLSAPAPWFLNTLTYTTSMAVPQALVKAHPADWWSGSTIVGVGSGPFKVAEWTHPTILRLVRNDKYWGTKPILKEIDYALYQDTGTAYNDWKGGKGSIVGVPGTSIPEAKSTYASSFHQFAYTEINYFQPNQHIAPFDNKDARIAFDAAIDRTSLCDVILHGACYATINYVPKGIPEYNPNVTSSWGASATAGLKADATAAQNHIKTYATAKCGGDVTKCPAVVITYYANDPGALALANGMLQMYQTNLPGYPVSVNAVDRHQALKNGKTLQFVEEGWIMDYPSAEDWMDLLLHAGTGYNTSFINNPAADALSDAADVDTNAADATQKYQQAEQLHINNADWIAWSSNYQNELVRSNVVGFAYNAGGLIADEALAAIYISQ